MQLLELRVRKPTVVEFYQKILGFHRRDGNLLFFPGQSTALKVRQSYDCPKTTASPTDGFWKLGITVPDLDETYRKLHEAGVEISKPSQFRDIGYLAHLRDPEGLTWELLAHKFHGVPNPDELCFRLGQVTLRINDPQKSIPFYQTLGLKLLSVQPVEPYRFTLYFLAETDEAPPNPNLESVENREWLWQRPYTTLELQHVWDGGIQPADNGGVGYQCLQFKDGTRELLDPDGHRLRV